MPQCHLLRNGMYPPRNSPKFFLPSTLKFSGFRLYHLMLLPHYRFIKCLLDNKNGKILMQSDEYMGVHSLWSLTISVSCSFLNAYHVYNMCQYCGKYKARSFLQGVHKVKEWKYRALGPCRKAVVSTGMEQGSLGCRWKPQRNLYGHEGDKGAHK